MILSVLSPAEWAEFSKEAHGVVFNEDRATDVDRISFAFITHEDDMPCSYMTCRETDSETVYMNYGGSFPGTIGTTKSLKSFQMFLEALSKRYKQGNLLTKNTNYPMIKLAMKCGMQITGIRNFKGTILLEHSITWR